MLLSVLLVLSLTQPRVLAAPSTFGDTFGSALLCHDRIDNAYFYDYLTASFGPAYKREGGAYWFRAEASLWGAEVSEAMVMKYRKMKPSTANTMLLAIT